MLEVIGEDTLYLITIKETAGRLRCSAASVYALIANGDLPVVRTGMHKGYRVDLRDLDLFVSNRKIRYRPLTVQMPTKQFKHLRA